MSQFLNETNIEITEVTIPKNESLDNVNEFLKTMGQQLKDINHVQPEKIIKSLNKGKIIIKGTRNEAYGIAKQLKWKMVRSNPPN